MAPDSVPTTERHSAPTSAAAPFFRGLIFALALSVPLWVGIAVGWWVA